ncbi:lipid A export permease/ATP-binding protein MsbA [Magnetofaba australis]|uniref:Putative lipid A ABC exporter, fused ATPase and inner membrane subunits MsbA n=1 Tax=Magnetofaba australis IT-1 TaxID=1434232 RepID=A0A1Y2K6J5_9PROT|nr:lipid A export permease/ATP-binding protein MsbA [Magnetofaba australis]OSM05173.1 putative lipid A ABC exporter, fused ATPase and inner membrane subunits MsbA [Magnetofaba australis IT-1]
MSLQPVNTVDNKALFLRFKDEVWPYRWLLLPAMVAMMVMAGTNGAIAYMVQPILDDLFIKQDRQMLLIVPMVILAIFLVRGAAYFVQTYLMEYVGLRVVRSMQVRLYNHLLALDMAQVLGNATGGYISRIISDTNLLKSAASSVIANIFREGFTVIVLLGMVFYQNFELALVSAIGLPAAGFLIYRFGRRMRKLSRIRQERMESVVSHLEQTISGLRVVRAFNMEPRERAEFRHITKAVFAIQKKAIFVRAVSNPSMDIIAGLVIFGVITYAGNAIIEGQTTTGAFFSFLTALIMAYTPIKRFTSLNNALQESLAAARRVFEFLDIPPTIVSPPAPRETPAVTQGVNFNNVTFRYAPDLPPVLRDLNLSVRAGERIALVGQSGSGKSTLVNLLPRFYDVTEGAIEIDGVDIRDISMRGLRSRISMVTQEVILFNDSVRNNIAYGGGSDDPDKIRQAAADANALEFIEKLPEGFDTVIGDRGVKLSGGQRQRLSIARSILKDSPILILDEATSALDTESERLVQQALDRLMEGRTTLVIAHRLSTIQNADRILVLRNGVIVEMGSHAVLLEKGGEYARLHAIQFHNEEPIGN